MPKPRGNETENQFMSRCIVQLEGEGKPHDQAVAQCISLWENRNKKGVNDMEILTKFFQSEVKAFNDKELIIDHFISTETPDRSDDIMRADGMEMDGVPVVLKQHGFDPDTGNEPIAKPLSISVGTNNKGVKGIIARTQYFDGRKLTPPDNTGQRLYLKAKEGVMPYWSVRFRSIEGEPRGNKGGTDFKRWSLFEYSQIGVPDNIEADTIKGMEKEELDKIIDKRIDFGFKEKEAPEKPEHEETPERGIEQLSEAKYSVTDKDGKKIVLDFETAIGKGFITIPERLTDDQKKVIKENIDLFEPVETVLKSIADRVAEDIPWSSMSSLWWGMMDELYASDGSDKAVKTILKEFGELVAPFAHAFAQATNKREDVEIKSYKEQINNKAYAVNESDTAEPPPEPDDNRSKPAGKLIIKAAQTKKKGLQFPCSKEAFQNMLKNIVKEDSKERIKSLTGEV